MSRKLIAFTPAFMVAAALCGCDVTWSGQNVGLQWIPAARARLDVPGVELGEGNGFEIEFWSCDHEPHEPELAIGAARYSLEGTAGDAWNISLRLGERAVLDRGGPAFVYGAAGVSFDVVDSGAFSTYATQILLVFPVGSYARAGIGARFGRVTVVAEALASAARVKQQSEDAVWFTTVAYSLGVGATF